MEIKVGKYVGKNIEEVLQGVEQEFRYKKEAEQERDKLKEKGVTILALLEGILVVDFEKKSKVEDDLVYLYNHTVYIGSIPIYDSYTVEGKIVNTYKDKYKSDKIMEYLIILYKCWVKVIETKYKEVGLSFTLKKESKAIKLLDAVTQYVIVSKLAKGSFDFNKNEAGVCVTVNKVDDVYTINLHTNTELAGSVLSSRLDILYLKLKYKIAYGLRGMKVFRKGKVKEDITLEDIDTLGRDIKNERYLREKNQG